MALLSSSNSDKIQQIDFTLDEIKQKFNRASAYLNLAKNNLQNSDSSVVYTNIYDAVRIACEAFLMLNQIKISSGEGHHYLAITTAKNYCTGLDMEFLRFEKMRRKRHDIEYGALIVSKDELNQAFLDAQKLLNRLNEIISEKDNQKQLL